MFRRLYTIQNSRASRGEIGEVCFARRNWRDMREGCGALHPSPFCGEGGHIVSGASDVTGGGCFGMRGTTPPGASRHPPPKRRGGTRKRELRSPQYTARAARSERCGCELFRCHCMQYHRIGGVHPSSLWGGRARRERGERCDGWGCFGVRRNNPTRLAFSQPPSP
jgi:hypothetical protein